MRYWLQIVPKISKNVRSATREFSLDCEFVTSKVFFRSDRCNQQNFYATEAALNFAMMAYNFISLFRQVVLGQKIHQQTKTLRYNVFAIGG
jgi:hypothetical protein